MDTEPGTAYERAYILSPILLSCDQTDEMQVNIDM